MSETMTIMLSELSEKGYAVFQLMTLVSVVVLNLYQAHKYKMTRIRCLLVTVLVYAMAYALMLFLYWAATGFRFWGGQNFIRVFIWIPVLAWPASKIVRTDWKATCDVAAPCMALAMGVGKFGCACSGCCYGYPCSWGLYNSGQEAILFPVQICEAVTAILIAVFLIIYVEKRKYPADGRAYALMLILFGATRFIWEFFRDNRKLFWGISELAIHAVTMFVVGCIAYFYVIPKWGMIGEHSDSAVQK